MSRIRLTKIASITADLDQIANDLQEINPAVSLAIDKVSDQLEGKPGQDPKKPGEVDISKIDPKKLDIKVTVTPGKTAGYRSMRATIEEIGLGVNFEELMKREAGIKDFLKKTWQDIKDKTTQATIKGLNTVEKAKTFVAQHPNLKWAVLAAIVLGVLAFPGVAIADVIPPDSIHNMAAQMKWNFVQSGGHTMMDVSLPKGFAEELLLKSLSGHGPVDVGNALSDLNKNLFNVIQEKGKMMGMLKDPDVFHQMAQMAFENIMHTLTPWLQKFGITP